MSNKIIKIAHNPVIAKVIEGSDEAKVMISDLLSYQIAGAEHMNLGSWDGITTFYSFKNDTFPAGFVRLVKRKLGNAGYQVLTKGKPAPEPRGPENPVVDGFGFDPKYDYQPATMQKLVELKGLIAQLSTGAGKSRAFKLCAARLGMTALFITTRKSLMYQMMESVRDTMNVEVGILGDGEWNPTPFGINFAIVDTLASRLEPFDLQKEIDRALEAQEKDIQKELVKTLKTLGLPANSSLTRNIPAQLKTRIAEIELEIRNKHKGKDKSLVEKIKAKGRIQEEKRAEALAFLENIEFLCLEEAHEVGSDSFYRIAQACKNAHYRLALTATPFMRDDIAANMRLMAATGPIGIKVSEKDLIDRGILAKPYFKYVKNSHTRRVSRGTGWQSAYANGVVDNVERNQQAVDEVLRAQQYGLTSMVLIQHSKHGENLLEMLTSAGVRAKFIFGKHKQSERKKALSKLKHGEIDCLIGSTILDVGVDVPSVGLIVLAGGGKAEVATRQRIGRGLRAKHAGPNVCFVVDFADDFNRHLHRHALERQRIIQETPGFVENIVEDFDYASFGFNKKRKVA